MSQLRRLALICVVALTSLSCAGTPTKTASTPSRIYDAPPDKVYRAAVTAFQNLGLELFKQDQSTWYVEGGRTPGFGRGSENVGVYIEVMEPGRTKVSIENRRAIAGYIFAVDWTDKLFEQIRSELGR